MKWALLLLPLSLVATAYAAESRPPYLDKLAKIRAQVTQIEDGLVETARQRDHAKANLKRLQTLIQLRREERAIGLSRMKELEGTVHELELRRESLNEKVAAQRKQLRKFLIAIEASTRDSSDGYGQDITLGSPTAKETFEAPRRKLLTNLASRGLKELEILKADVSDADQLESRIQEEKQQVAYLFQDLDEKESVLELNRQLQTDLLKKSHDGRLAQLENYRKLKSSQAQVEHMISDFNARRELERVQENERKANRLAAQAATALKETASSDPLRSEFERLKGRLSFPVNGATVITGFGRAFDSKSGMYIFKKGVDLRAGSGKQVRAIYPGKVAFAGELPDYGRVAIIDHGGHYYSLCAHLGALQRRTGDSLAAGDAIGMTDESGIVYFEIRSRNVAVNPLQWVSESSTLE